MEIRLKPYNKKYPKYYGMEKKALQKLGKFEIHHVGSTAVPGMAGKGWIDILIIVKDAAARRALADRLIGFGYSARTTVNKNRLFFSRKGRVRYHIHLVTKKYKRAREQIRFKDFLLKNPEAAKEYLQLKKRNFKLSKGERVKYKKLKYSYFNKIMKEI